jgi:hypothetical protein
LLNFYGDYALYDASITRQDTTVILMNYVKYKKLNTTTNGTKYTACTDYKKVSGYAANAIEWA